MNKPLFSLGLLLALFIALYPQLTVAVSSVYTEKPFENPGADAPPLDLPADVTQLAQSVVDTTSLTSAIAAVEAVLGQGGVAVKDHGSLLNQPGQPLADAYIEAINLADIALEAQSRPSASTLSARQLADMLADFGWPALKNKNAAASLMFFLKTWLQAALNSPDDPSRFAILFIAANNQLQAPKANLVWAEQNPDLVRFSRLELELLSAAFERVLVTPASSKSVNGACATLSRQFGKWNDSAAVIAGQLSDSALSTALKTLYGPSTGNFNARTSNALYALSLAAKTFKFTQLLRYGALSVNVDGDQVVTKPTLGKPDIVGTLSAQVGVDQVTYAEYQASAKQYSAQAAADNKACLDYLELPQTTLTDNVTNAKNWRVEWGLGVGFDQVHWQDQPLSLSLTKPLTADSPTEASSSVSYLIEKQPNKTISPSTREQTEVFTAKLTPVNGATLWGQGAAGFAAASLSNSGYQHFAALMGFDIISSKGRIAPPSLASMSLASLMTDTVSQWALAVISPKRVIKQVFKENKPKGWTGTIDILYESTDNVYITENSQDIRGGSRSEDNIFEHSYFKLYGDDGLSSDVRGSATARTDCTQKTDYVRMWQFYGDGEGSGGWSNDNEVVNTSQYAVTSGLVDTNIQLLVYTKAYIAFVLQTIPSSEQELIKYWKTKADTWELYVVSPKCEGKKQRVLKTVYELWEYDFNKSQWVKSKLSKPLKITYADVVDPMKTLITPLLTGKLKKGKDPRIIDVAKIIKLNDWLTHIGNVKHEQHELLKVTIHLSLVK